MKRSAASQEAIAMPALGWLCLLAVFMLGRAPAFATGVGSNILNLMVVGTLVARQRLSRREAYV